MPDVTVPFTPDAAATASAVTTPGLEALVGLAVLVGGGLYCLYVAGTRLRSRD